MTRTRIIVMLLCAALGARAAAQGTYEGLVEQGLEALAEDSLTKAEGLITQAMRLRPAAPANYLLFRYLGQIQERQGRHAEALESFTLGIGLAPKCEELFLDRAALHYRMGNTEKAVYDYGDALYINPDNAEALFMRAHLFRQQREYKRSRADYEHLIQLDPMNEQARLGLILLNDESSRPREAMDQINALIALYPHRAVLYAVRGGMEHRRKQYEAALADLTCAIEMDGTNADFYVSRATLYMDVKKKKQARADLQKAVALGADPRELASLLAR